MRTLYITLFLIALTSPPSSHADFILSPSVTYLDQQVRDNSGSPSTSEAKLTVIDFRLGYVTDFGLYIGGLYSIHDQQIFAKASDSYFGPSLGYYNSGFFVSGTYYIYGERDLTAGGIKYSKVQGFQVDLSYGVPLAEGVLIGPQLTYHNVHFREEQVIGVAQSADFKWSGLTPYINLTLLF
jgi:hypothetical protein